VKRFDWSMMRVPAVVFAVGIPAATFAAANFLSAEIGRSVFVGGVMCFAHIAAGFVILELSFHSTPTSFLKRVLGGMGLRLAAMLAVLVALLKTQAFHTTALMLGLLAWYGLGLVFEVAMLNKKVTMKQLMSDEQ